MRNTARSICIPGLRAGMARNNVTLADVMGKVVEITKAHSQFKAKHDETLEEHGDEISRLSAENRELNNKLAAAARAPRGTGDGDLADVDVVARGRKALNNIARGIKAALTTDTDPDGGFLVESAHDRVIRGIASNLSGLRKVAGVIEITKGEYIRTVNLAGTEAGWTQERSSRPVTTGPKFAQIELPTHEIYALPLISQKLLEDAEVDIGAEVEKSIGVRFGELEGDAFINGDGVGKPYGILNDVYPKVLVASAAWGKVAYVKTGDANGFIAPTTSASPADCLYDLLYSLHSSYRGNATWLFNSNTASVLRKLKDADGRFLWADSVAVGEPNRLMGYAIQIDEFMPDIAANKYPVAFGSWSEAYQIIDRIGMKVLRDEYTVRPHVGIYARKRVGGGLVNYQALRLLKVAV